MARLICLTLLPRSTTFYPLTTNVWPPSSKPTMDDDFLWSNNDASSAEASPYDVPRLEAHLYYAGISGGRRGPKLIYRTSSDKFVPPAGPQAHRRLMELTPVYGHKLGEHGLWARVGREIVRLLDERGIQFSSIDVIRFTWDENDEQENGVEDEENANNDDPASIKPVKEKKVYTTPVTIWIGVLPDSTTGEQAYHSSKEILDLLKQHDITDVDVAYCESVVQSLAESSHS